MKVLYTSVYRDGTGYAKAALDYILALDAAGVDVVCRPIKLNDATPPIPERIKELEAKPNRGPYDAVIQHILPPFFDYNGYIPHNIGMFATETDTLNSNWADYAQTMDSVWVFNEQSSTTVKRGTKNLPVRIIPHATDVTRFQKSYNPLPFKDAIKDDFVFYFIGEYNKRKNLIGLLQAFHLEFDIEEPVQLVIKVSCPHPITNEIDAARFKVEATNYVTKVKEMMRFEKTKQEILITHPMSDEDIMRLHAAGDCFVCPSHGEAWCIPAFDAMALGKTPVVSDYGGFQEYIDYNTGYLVSGVEIPAYGMTHAVDGLFSSREKWFQADIDNLRLAMRAAYNDRENNPKSRNGIKRAYDYSHKRIGKLMMEELQK